MAGAVSRTPPARWATVSSIERWFMSTACVTALGAMSRAFAMFVFGVSTSNVVTVRTLAGAELTIASPDAYRLADLPHIQHVTDPAAAVAGADIVYTDVWTSMGQEDEAAVRRTAFVGYQVDAQLMDAAGDKTLFLHCLPAHRGEEVSDEVLEGPQSRVWRQAENRMHTARGALAWLAGSR